MSMRDGHVHETLGSISDSAVKGNKSLEHGVPGMAAHI